MTKQKTTKKSMSCQKGKKTFPFPSFFPFCHFIFFKNISMQVTLFLLFHSPKNKK